MKIRVYTRNFNTELYSKMVEFLPKELDLYPIAGMNNDEDAVNYLYALFDNAVADGIDFAVNIDEDCFMLEFKAVYSIIETMQAGNYSHAGMPDGGAHPGRTRSWAVLNPFFNVFNVKELAKIGKPEVLNKFKDIANHKAPDLSKLPYKIDHDAEMIEPFDGLFYWLHEFGKPYYLYTKIWDDDLTTELFHNEEPFCVHTWYSRYYGKDNNVTNRINLIYEDCRNRVLAG